MDSQVGCTGPGGIAGRCVTATATAALRPARIASRERLVCAGWSDAFVFELVRAKSGGENFMAKTAKAKSVMVRE
jgi:hypothetical protein